MPELPEVEALREYLDEHLTGRVVERVLPLAVSVLKTYDPPLTALEGQPAGPTDRYGKFLSLRIGELHLVTHLARAHGLAAGQLKAEKKSGLRVHGRAGEPCPVCGDTVRSVSFADSSLEYCPTCQTGGKPLADRRLSRLLK
ncbi:hypothetical protein OG756_35035 [Streptomyces sp. NBC_01310]|uniref:DNA-formamidopyrimidine glycosylase family protein n=1 Tax=Streptomyces sp. NBC_01310 TaxID=2903820 RepID=UPI0035B59291|nr:hypothetical protein OG756_35035 [Streptomyces sp. NBC_01310]